VLPYVSVLEPMATKAVIDRLESEWHRAAPVRNLKSINGRRQADGYFPESLTGGCPACLGNPGGAAAGRRVLAVNG